MTKRYEIDCSQFYGEIIRVFYKNKFNSLLNLEGNLINDDGQKIIIKLKGSKDLNKIDKSKINYIISINNPLNIGIIPFPDL